MPSGANKHRDKDADIAEMAVPASSLRLSPSSLHALSILINLAPVAYLDGEHNKLLVLDFA